MPWYWSTNSMPDLFGKVAIVTGGNSGLGFEIARHLCEHHANVVIAVRNELSGKRAVQAIRKELPYAKVQMMLCDMASLRSVDHFVDAFRAAHRRLDILVNNAGVLDPAPGLALTGDYYEVTMQTNYLSAVYLTHSLLDVLKHGSVPSRVVNMSSVGEAYGSVDWNDLGGMRLDSSGWQAYARSKLFLIMWTRELNRRLKGCGVDVFAVHPGICMTPGELKSDKSHLSAVVALVHAVINGQRPQDGALSALYAATEPSLQGRGGKYIGPNVWGFQLLGFAGSNTAERRPLNRWAREPAACKKLVDQTLLMLREHKPDLLQA